MEQYNFDKYDFKRNLILVGSPGIGKTYQAKKILDRVEQVNILSKYHMTDGRFKQFTQSNGLNLRAAIDWQNGLELYPMEVMIRCKILLYDDLGVSDVTPSYIRNLTFMLDERIEKKLPTIFTTNLTAKELEEKLDERIVSRILLNADIIQMSGKDKRKETAVQYSFAVKKEEE